VLRGGDGVDSIVPNEMLVSSVVESETFSNTVMRASLQVGSPTRATSSARWR
jgi:small-conductance mechanosensitive channel